MAAGRTIQPGGPRVGDPWLATSKLLSVLQRAVTAKFGNNEMR